MSKNKIITPNVVRGGIAIPLKGKTNYYYMSGRKHKNGGIDIGQNPRTGLEVEDGEVMHVADNEIKVFSSVPFLNGKSPAQKVLGGENPNTVFKQQEEFKDRNGINDDGSKKKEYDGPINPIKRAFITTLTNNEESQFQDWYRKVAKHKGLNPDPDAEGQNYDYRGYWKNEDRNGILGSNPNAHFKDKYKQPSHPTFSNQSKYSNILTPGGEWVEGKGTWLFKHNNFTSRQAKRTHDYLTDTGEGYILGTDTIIPRSKKENGGRLRNIDYKTIFKRVKNKYNKQNTSPVLNERYVTKKDNTNVVPTYGKKLIKNEPSKVKQFITASTGAIRRKIFDEKSPATVIDLSNKNVDRITNDTENVSSILFNEFVEDNSNNIRRKKDFINTSDTLIGDRKIPLSKISLYYGIENGKLKVGNINNFNDNTTIVPVRNKSVGRIKKIINNPVPEDSISIYEEQLENLRKAISKERDDYLINLSKKHNLKPTIGDRIHSFLFNRNPNIYPAIRYRQEHKIAMPFTEKQKQYYDIKYKVKPSIKFITENNDTIDSKNLRIGENKSIFADEQGNAIFINNIHKLNNNQLNTLNNKLSKTPLYPVLVDNGRYSHYYENVDPLHGYDRYVSQDFYRDPKSLFVVGTTNKKAMGGISSLKDYNSSYKRKYKAGGVYSVTVDGKTTLKRFPSTGSRTKAALGTKSDNKVDYRQLLYDMQQLRKNTYIDYNGDNNDSNDKNTQKEFISPLQSNVPKENYVDSGLKNTYVNADIIKNHKLNPIPVNNFRTKFKNYIKEHPNTISDAIGLTSNIVGGLISHGINRRMLDKLKYSPEPIAKSAAKLKTRININPQLDKMRESLAAYENDINNSTASSNVALARKQRARFANSLQTNELYGNKENTETELINKDRINQQSVANENIRDYNTWLQNKTTFDNTIAEKQAENSVGLIETINSGVQNMLTNRDKRRSEQQSIAAMSLANPDLPIEVLYEQKLISKKTYDAYKKAYRARNKNNAN